MGFINNLSTNSCIYYTNNQTENNIITKIEISKTVPKYINEDNLIFIIQIKLSRNPLELQKKNINSENRPIYKRTI